METLGQRIAMLRRQKELKQDEIAEMLHVTPQAVSKWENDQTCPDITLLPELSRILGVTVDQLLTGASAQPETRLVPVEERKDINDMMLRVIMDSADGDKLRVNLPMGLVQAALDMGMAPEISGSKAFKSINFTQILALVRQGAVGNLVEIESTDGDMIRVFVE